VRDPAFGIAALWITADLSDQARAAGCTVVDPVSVLGTHLSELIRRHAHEIFGRNDAKKFLDRVTESNPRAVEDLVPKLIPLPTLQKVLQNLLRERVPIKDAATIIESLGEAAAITRNPVLLTEYVRQSLRRTLVRPYLDGRSELPVSFLDSALERSIEQAVEHGELASHLNLNPQRVNELMEAARSAPASGSSAWVLLVSSGARFFVRQILEAQYPLVAVLAHGEIPPGTHVTSLGTLKGTSSK